MEEPTPLPPVQPPVETKDDKIATRVGIIIVIVIGVLFIILAAIVALNLPSLLSKRSTQTSCEANGCIVPDNGKNSQGTNNSSSAQNANVTLGKMSYFAPTSWHELSYPGTNQSGQVNMRGDVIANSSGTSLIGVYHYAKPDTQPVSGVARQKQKADDSLAIMKNQTTADMVSARYAYGETYLACASNFVYTEPLREVTDAKTGKYGIEYAYTCKSENDLNIIGFHGAYFDTGDTLHSFDIIGIDSSWNKHLDEIKQIRDSVTLN